MSTQSPFDSNSPQTAVWMVGLWVGEQLPGGHLSGPPAWADSPRGQQTPSCPKGPGAVLGWGEMGWEVGRGARREGTG